jgi:hypothetical protein
MVEIHKLSQAIMKWSLKETSKFSRSLYSLFFHDTILYILEDGQEKLNHGPENINGGSPIILI